MIKLITNNQTKNRPNCARLGTVKVSVADLLCKATHAEQSGMAATCGNVNFDDKLLKEELFNLRRRGIFEEVMTTNLGLTFYWTTLYQ